LKDKIEPLFAGARPELGFDIIDRVTQNIKKAFFRDKFRIDLGDRATTVEVMQKRDEQLRSLGPISGRLNRELLKPIVSRLFGIMDRRGSFGDHPQELKSAKLEVRYLSAIAQAQKATQADNISRAIGASADILGMQPEVMDNVDGDKLLRNNFDIFGVDPALLRKESEVLDLRKQRQEAANAQAQQEASAAEADVINKVGQVDNQQGGQ
jgi:hypothetical protein